MISTLVVMALGAIVLGAALGYASIRFKVEGNPLVEKVDAILPQTQCGQCGFREADPGTFGVPGRVGWGQGQGRTPVDEGAGHCPLGDEVSL